MKKNCSLSLLSLLCALSVPVQAADTPVTVQTFAQASLQGIQLAVKHARQNGKVSDATADCVAALKPGSFTDIYEKMLQSELTEEERQGTEAFFKSAVGAKYARRGLLQIYQAVGETAPEPLPELSPSEIAEVEKFSKTSAGDKLMYKKILEQPAAIAPVNQRIKELLTQCAPKK